MSGKAQIPGGWRQVRLGDVATLQRGIDLPEADRIAGKYQFTGQMGCWVITTHPLSMDPG